MKSQTMEDLTAAEIVYADGAFPDYHSAHEGWAVLREEVDELWDAVKRDDAGAIALEAIQIRAVIERFILCCTDDNQADYVRGFQRQRSA